MADYETDMKQVTDFHDANPNFECLRESHINIVELIHFLRIDPAFLKELNLS
jgi:hypothetical protein